VPAPPQRGVAGRIRLPVTDIYLPNGLHVQVVPGQVPTIGTLPVPPGGSVVPQVQVRPGPTVQDVRDMVRGRLPRRVVP
jgi:hypothetical protein